MWRRWSAVALGVLFSVTAFAVGFVNDDLVQRLWLEGKIAGYSASPWALYSFTGARSSDWLVAKQYLPWFTNAGWSLRFFRPLSSLSLALDHWLFGRNAAWAHVHSLLWFTLLAVAAVGLFRRWLPQRAAVLASIVYVLAGGQSMSVAWIASRHTLVGGAFGALSLLAYTRARQSAWRPGAWLAPVGLVLGLVSSELGLGVAVFVVLFEALERREARLERLRAALPVVLITALYLFGYAALGYGAQGSAAYVSPFSSPFAYLAAIPTRVPQLCAELFVALPSMIASALPTAGARLFAAVGATATLAVAALLNLNSAQHGPELQRRLWFLFVSSVVSLLPMAGGFVGGRMLPLASLGAAAVIGTLLDTLWQRTRALSGPRLWIVYPVAIALALPHLVLAPLVRLGLPLVFRQLENTERTLARRAEIDGCAPGSTGYLLTGSDPTAAMYAGVALGFFEPARAARLRGFTPLSMAPNDQRIERLSDDTFELTVVDRGAMSPFEAVYRRSHFHGNEAMRSDALDATVVAAIHGMPTRVRFRVHGGLEQACLLRWHDGALRRVQLALGQAVELPHEPGPSGF